MGTQKDGLSETVLFEHPKHMLRLIGKKIFTILRSKILLSKPMRHYSDQLTIFLIFPRPLDKGT